MVHSERTGLGLPLLTMGRHHTKCTMSQGGSDAYQTLPESMLAVRNPLVILDWSTNAYHLPDLALLLPCATFTNHYHRGLGRGIDLSVVASVVGWASVARVIHS